MRYTKEQYYQRRLDKWYCCYSRDPHFYSAANRDAMQDIEAAEDAGVEWKSESKGIPDEQRQAN